MFFVSCSNQSIEIEKIIDGTYDLVEWNQNNETFNAPDVSGRVIFFDGKFSAAFHKGSIQKNILHMLVLVITNLKIISLHIDTLTLSLLMEMKVISILATQINPMVMVNIDGMSMN